MILFSNNCSFHIAQSTMDYFQNRGIDDLNWPSRRSDLNIVANAWKMLNFLCEN